MPEEREQEVERQIVVPEHLKADRADKILAKIVPQLSRSRWQKLLKEGRVWQDDRLLTQKTRIGPEMVVEYSLPPVKPMELRPVPMELSILYEDEDIVVLDKAAGMVVHPGAGTGEDTLVHGLLHHCRGSLSGIGGTERPGIVHRLDKETSGAMVVAKTDEALQSLAAQFADRVVKKFYLALVLGVPEEQWGIIREPIGRHPVHRTRMHVTRNGRFAQTDVRMLKAWPPAAALMEAFLHTGRTHQIRVHLKHAGHPILGDELYGYKPGRLEAATRGRSIAVPRVMLHARKLGFLHPVSGKELEFDAPVPEDFRGVMATLDGIVPPSESR